MISDLFNCEGQFLFKVLAEIEIQKMKAFGETKDSKLVQIYHFLTPTMTIHYKLGPFKCKRTQKLYLEV